MLGRILRHEAFHSPGVWLAQSAAVGGALLGFFAWRRYTLGGAESAMQQLLAICWVLVGLYLLVGRVHTRCSALDLALPVPARRLWLTHVTAVVLSTVPMIGIVLGLLALLQWALVDVRGAPLAALSLVAVAAHLGAGLILAVVALESLQLELVEAPRGWRVGGLRLAVLAAVAGLSVALGAYALPIVLLPLGLAAALGARILRRLPETFSLAPREPRRQDRPGHAAGTGLGETWATTPADLGPLRLLARLFLCIHGARFGAATPWISYPWVVLMGSIAGGLLTSWNELSELRFLYIPLYAFILFSPVPAAVEQLAHLDPLPIGRRALFALVTLPSLAFFLLGYGAGHVGFMMARESTDLIEYRRTARDGPYCVCVPASRHEIAWDGRSPATAAPWGETHTASGIPLFSGSRIHLYSPYEVFRESSPAYVAFQISRAIEAVYGRHIPPIEIRKRYLEVAGNEVALKGDRLTLRADYPDLVPLGQGPLFPFLLSATTLPFLLLTALFLRTYRGGLSRRWRKVVWIGAMVIVLGLVGLQVALAVADFMEPSAGRAFLEILLRGLGETAAGTLAAWTVSLLLVLGGYRLAESLLLRAELPASPDPACLPGGSTSG